MRERWSCTAAGRAWWSPPGCRRSSGGSPAWWNRSTSHGRRCRRTSIAWAPRWARRPSRWSSLVVVIGLLRGLPVIEMFMFGIALAVAVVPEALPGGRDHLACHRRAADGQAQRAGAPAADRGDARQHIGHLFRQDRHTDAE